jgi:hypothetical protein
MKHGKIYHRLEIIRPRKDQFVTMEHFEIYNSQLNYLEITEEDMALFKHREPETEIQEKEKASISEFIKAVKEELKFLGYTIDELASSSYINNERLRSLLQGKKKFTPEEIKEIKKKLYID